MNYPKPSPVKPTDIEYLIDEIHTLNREIHQYLRMPQLILNLAISSLPLIISQGLGDKPTDLTLLFAPLVFSILAMYNLNIAAEAAGLAEIRDRLSNYVNNAINQPVFLTRVLSDVRRGSLGTAVAYGLAFVVILITMIYGLIHASQVSKQWFMLQILVTIGSIVAMLIGVFELASTRLKIHDALDTIFGESTRPTSAPSHRDKIYKHYFTAFTKRRAE